MKTNLEILQEAYRIIDNPKRWTQGANARTFFGIKVDANSIWARRWCASGAIFKAAGKRSEGILTLIEIGAGLPSINDRDCGWEAVRWEMRRRIALLQLPKQSAEVFQLAYRLKGKAA